MNHLSIPVNAPLCPHHACHRDGQMRVDGNHGSTLGYQPNSYSEWEEQPEFREPPLEIQGAMDSYEPKEDQTDNCFYQAGDLFRLMSEAQKQVLIENTARNMNGTTANIRYRHAAHCYLADPDYGGRLAKALELDWGEVLRLSKRHRKELMQATRLA